MKYVKRRYTKPTTVSKHTRKVGGKRITVKTHKRNVNRVQYGNKRITNAQYRASIKKLAPFADADGDGVNNWNDCRPFDRTKQDSSRGFAILYTNTKNIHFDLLETPNGFIWVSNDGTSKKIGSSDRNWMWAEGKARELFLNRIKQEIRKDNFKKAYSSMWHEPNPKYFTKSELYEIYRKK